jgi:putative membrane protein
MATIATFDEFGDAMSTPTAEDSTPTEARKGFYVHGWLLAVIGAVVVIAAGFAIGLAIDRGGDGARGGGRDFGRFGEHHGGGGHGLGIIVLLILIAVAIAGVVFIARRFISRSNEARTGAEELLAERFARGEIDEADYLSRRNALRS